ncbi:MAG: flagellar basal body L-ring protein [Rhodospirillaceae bacterium TMED167]|nr:flagellar basal body L-ring protein [Rhodospirillaceae bacterium]OUW31093.1 MAG: flagellar basal body L-ring protein [Rhodospirillaceae bacterium TMED167]
MRTINPICHRFGTLVALCLLLSACNTFTRLSEVNNGPQVSEIANPTARPKYRPVSMPMPAPKSINRKANSLWRPGARAFFRDQRAGQVGDILTVKLSIDDSAALANKTSRKRDDKEDADVTKLLGLEAELTKVLPQAITPATTLSLGTQHETSGDGAVDRSESVAITIAAVITQVLPNGNLVIFARQEIKVNFELREVMVTGVIRPEDIDSSNSISHEQIAEMRVAYGGRGTLSDLQQPRYGTQIIDIVFPF